MFFEASDKNLSDIEADAIIMTKIYKDSFEINEKDNKKKQLILDDYVSGTEEFIDFIKRIIEKNKDVFEKIIIVIIGKSFRLQDSEINNRVVNALKDQENDFLEFILKPYQHKLKKIIFKTSQEQYQDFKKKWSLIANWSTGKQLSFVIDSLDINNTQDMVCKEYDLNPGRFGKYLQKFCTENRNYLENRNENILKEKYGEVVCILPEKIAKFSELFKNFKPTQMKKFINEAFPEIFQKCDQDLNVLEDIIWRLNTRMGAGEKLFFYVAHLTPEKIINDKIVSVLYKKRRVNHMAIEDMEEEVSTHYENFLNKVQKIKLFNKILDEKSGEHIFPINQLEVFWGDFEENLIPKRTGNNKTERIGIWEKIMSEEHSAGNIIAELLSAYYNKAPDTINGYYQKRMKKLN